jgi:hypothetical protein
MTLSIAIVTKDSAAYVEPLLRAARALADEVVIAVDATSTDRTEAICARYADKLFRVPLAGYSGPAVHWLYRHCEGDWILRLDDDELPSEGLAAALPRLLADRDVTHYWMPIRWIVDQQRTRWIAQGPWAPEWRGRLHRNIASVVTPPALIHSGYRFLGRGRYLRNAAIYYLDLIVHDSERRRQKEQRYQRLRPEFSAGHPYVLPPDLKLVTRPLPAGDGIFTAPRRPRLPLRRARQATVVDDEALYTAQPGEAVLPDSLFRAEIVCDDPPETLQRGPGNLRLVELRLTNLSEAPWPIVDERLPVVRVAYHWLRSDGTVHVWDGNRGDLIDPLPPGGTAQLILAIVPPLECGAFLLRWDLVIEGYTWFSARGWQGPEVRVQVVP